MRFEIAWRKHSHVIGVQPRPLLTIFYRSKTYPWGDVAHLSLQRLWCRLAGHRFNAWEQQKYLSSQARQCQRCAKWESRDHA